MKDNIPVQFKKIVDREEVRLNSLLSGKEFNLVDAEERENPKLANMDFIQFFILNKIGLKHGELLTPDRIQVLYNSYFASEDCFRNLMSGIQEIKAAKPNTTFPLSNGTFSFNTGDGYLYAASSGSNYLRTEATKSAREQNKANKEGMLDTAYAQIKGRKKGERKK